MPVIKVDAKNLSSVLTADAKGVRTAFHQGLISAAHKARTRLVRGSPVDRGMLKNAWEIKRGGEKDPVNLENSAPYAGVVERGIRPGAQFGRTALEALTGWVKRKILKGKIRANRALLRRASAEDRRTAQLNIDTEAERIARAILEKWKREGRAGTFFVKGQLPHLAKDARDEVFREIQQYFKKRPSSV